MELISLNAMPHGKRSTATDKKLELQARIQEMLGTSHTG